MIGALSGIPLMAVAPAGTSSRTIFTGGPSSGLASDGETLFVRVAGSVVAIEEEATVLYADDGLAADLARKIAVDDRHVYFDHGDARALLRCPKATDVQSDPTDPASGCDEVHPGPVAGIGRVADAIYFTTVAGGLQRVQTAPSLP